MIEPNAKCVVNGGKLNELISWINESMEELDIVDQNNRASKKWFLVSGAGDINQGTGTNTDRDNLTSSGASAAGSSADSNRNSLNRTTGGSGNGSSPANTTLPDAGGPSDRPSERDIEMQRRNLEAFKKQRGGSSTETFLQDAATKKRQAEADALGFANRNS